jgi:hypothetical protein
MLTEVKLPILHLIGSYAVILTIRQATLGLAQPGVCATTFGPNARSRTSSANVVYSVPAGQVAATSIAGYRIPPVHNRLLLGQGIARIRCVTG